MDSGKDDGQAGQQKQEQQPPQQQQHVPVATPTEQLPSFYSPRTQPVVPDHEGDYSLRSDLLNISALAATARAAPTSAPSSTHAPTTGATTPSNEQPPPPSLLSPQFTPPATPGFATPTSESQPPRGVPVDTARDSSTKKRPRLLETLPEVQCVVRARIPTVAGTEMFLHLYTNNVDSKEHLAIVFGPHIRSRSLDAPREGETEMDRMVRGAYTGRLFPGRTQSGMMLSGGGRAEEQQETSASSQQPPQQEQQQQQQHQSHNAPLVRIHSECYTGETAWSARCDCGEQLDEAARLMSLPAQAQHGGIIIYLRQEGRGIGLGEKLKAYNLQDLGSDTVEANLLLRHPADARSYGLATAMLRDLGQDEVRLLTNNPDKIRAVEGPNREVRVVERVAMVPLSWKGKKGEGFRSQEVEGYLRTKIEKMGHMLDMGGMPP